MKDIGLIQNNRLIAEFMGARLTHPHIYEYEIYPTEHSSKYWDDYAMLYHKEWNWLMPVVEKIEKLGFNTNVSYEYMSRKHRAGIFDDAYRNFAKGIRFSNEGENQLTNMYLSVIQFIHHYNNQSNGK